MQNQAQRLSFTGTGSEYFRIWIVNLFLTILTLGIYSAWAKVRRMQYFYRNTHLNDSSFDYHGTPLAILKGRLIGVALFGLYYASINVMPLLGIAVWLGIVVLMPLLLVASFRFRLYNTSYRGLRFSFVGSIKEAYVAFLALPLITVLTLYLMAPFNHHYIKEYQLSNSRFGQTRFSFTAGAGGFYKIYLFAFLQLLLITALLGYTAYSLFGESLGGKPSQEAMMSSIIAIYMLMIVVTLLIVPYFIARIQNLVWNHTWLGEHRFSSTLTVSGLAWIIFSNFVFIILTLGLFKPFADIRMARYKMERMAFWPAADMEEFIASEQQQISATGTETAEVFDVDIGF